MEEELGALVAPQQGGGWSKLLEDPISRSALLSFGLQAMTGGWGNGTQQLAAALGAGATGAGATAEAMQKQAQFQQTADDRLGESQANRESREREAELNRASREEISRITADNRLDVTRERVSGMLERARLTRQPQTSQELKFYNDQLGKVGMAMRDEMDKMGVKGNAREELIKARALERLEDARRQGLFGPSGGGAAGSAPAAKPAPSPEPDAGSPPPGRNSSVDVGLFPPRIILGEANVLYNKLKDDPKVGPQFQQDLQTPEGRAKIIAKFPVLKDLVKP